MGKEGQPNTPKPGDRQPTHEGGRQGQGSRPAGTGWPGGPQDAGKSGGGKKSG